jgi:hypothetical protein
MGSTLFVLQNDLSDRSDNLPIELRKRLMEIGWEQDDTGRDTKSDRARTPLTLLPYDQLDRLDITSDVTPLPNMSPSPSASTLSAASPDPDRSLVRRKSSTVGAAQGVKRRPVFVPPLAALLPDLALLVTDADYETAQEAQEIVTNLMRNDPALLTRPIFDLFTEDRRNLEVGVSVLDAICHMRPTLPPAMAHAIFNLLTGFVKYLSRREDAVNPLKSFAQAAPILSYVGPQVSGMSFKEIRRTKVEYLILPASTSWFGEDTPPVAMFPRSYGVAPNPFEMAPPRFVDVTMIRLAQINHLLAMIKKSPQDAQNVRKSLPQLVFPTEYEGGNLRLLDPIDFIPRKSELSQPNASTFEHGLQELSKMICRSYVLLVAQVFRTMPRHLSDRGELSTLVDALNRILLAHGGDIGIVAQVLIAYMVASTRFRRLFTSGGAYAMFAPTLLKVYCEAEANEGIRAAVEYTVNRFYALHQDNFVFQSVDAFTRMSLLPPADFDWMAGNIYNLFWTLRPGASPITLDAAGIRNINREQEREALMFSTAEDKPQTFLASLRSTQSSGRAPLRVDLPEEYAAARMPIDNLAKLFLTVIAHDPSILRAEQFLRLFRYMVPKLYHAQNSTRQVLREGIDAIGMILSKVSGKGRNEGEESGTHGFNLPTLDAGAGEKRKGKGKEPSDALAMRFDYLALVAAFAKAGGKLHPAAHLHVMELATTMLKDSTIELLQLLRRSDPGEVQQLRRVERPGAQKNLLPSSHSIHRR